MTSEKAESEGNCNNEDGSIELLVKASCRQFLLFWKEYTSHFLHRARQSDRGKGGREALLVVDMPSNSSERASIRLRM